MILMSRENYKIGFLYGTDPDTEKLAKRFAGHLINDDEFCTACELLDKKFKCDHCREELPCFASSIYFLEKIGEGVPAFIDEPLDFLPKHLPPVDYLIVVGVHQDLLAGLPEFLKDKEIRGVIVPIEDPSWVPPGLQTQVLNEFEKYGIQAAFPKPFCSLSKEQNQYNQPGFHITKNHQNIDEFIDYFRIGAPVVSLKLSKNGKTIEDGTIIRSAPCGSTFFIVQQLHSTDFGNGEEISLNERISKAHHSFPCSASMDQDSQLKDSILHVGGYLVRNAIRKELGLEEEEGQKLKYVIK